MALTASMTSARDMGGIYQFFMVLQIHFSNVKDRYECGAQRNTHYLLRLVGRSPPSSKGFR